MEHFITNMLVQSPGETRALANFMCGLWNWGFWIAFILGVVGTIVAFFRKPSENNL